MQLGDLYESQLQQPPDAVDAYRRALDVNPRNFAAMDALERIHRAEEEWVDCIEVMERRVSGLDDPAQKVQVLLAIAAMWAEHAGDADRGTSAYERILELEPMHQVAFQQLEQLHRDAGRWEPLIEVYLNRVDSSEDLAEVIDLYRRVASTNEQHLKDLPQALAALMLAWRSDFTNDETANELERVAALAGDWNEPLNLANETLQELSSADSAEERQIEDRPLPALCEVVRPGARAPRVRGPLLQPDPLAGPDQLRGHAVSRPTSTGTLGQWQMLAQTLGRMAEVVRGGKERAAVFAQMGELCEEHLGMPEQAPSYFRQAIEADPTNLAAIGNLERLAKNASDWDDLLEMLKLKVAALTEDEEVREARLAVAEVYELRLERVDDAIQEYTQILSIAPAELRALKGLERLHAQRENWQDLFNVLEREYDLVSTDKERVSILSRLASMLEEEFVKPELAAERLEQVLQIDPNNESALRGLERLYRNLQRWDALIRDLRAPRHRDARPDAEGRMLRGDRRHPRRRAG